MTKHIGIMCATYNEEENVLELFKAIQSQLDPLRDDFSYSVLFIDNNSTDSTQLRLSELDPIRRKSNVYITNGIMVPTDHPFMECFKLQVMLS